MGPLGSCPLFFVSGYVSPLLVCNTLYQSPQRRYTRRLLAILSAALFRPPRTLPNSTLSTNRGHSYYNQPNHSILQPFTSRDVTDPNTYYPSTLYTHSVSRCPSANNTLLHAFTNIGQSNIPISTAAPTHYVRFYTHTFPILFGKIWALFLGPLERMPSIYRFPFFRYVST